MTRETQDAVVGYCVVAVGIAVCLGVIWLIVIGFSAIGREICDQRWAGSRMGTDWSVLTGCMVKTKDGRWIPASSYREIDR